MTGSPVAAVNARTRWKRDPGNIGDLVERQGIAEMVFDKPERFLGWIHAGNGLVFEASASCALRECRA
jgi:hypothetical protein